MIWVALIAIALAALVFFRTYRPPPKFTGGNDEPGADPMDASAWRIGPIIRGVNHSRGMPLRPSPHPDGWCFDFPQQGAGNVDYVTFHHGPLTGKSRITMRYRIEAEPGVEMLPADFPGYPGIISLHFQRKGDTWSGRGKYDTYRWYTSEDDLKLLTPGEHELSVPLEGRRWNGVSQANSLIAPREFEEAKDNAQAVGFVLGGGEASGHGAYATGPARFIVTGFEVA